MLFGRRFGRLLAAWILIAGVYAPATEIAWADEGQKKVLVLYTTRRDTQFSIIGDQTMPGLLDRGLGAKVDYYSEYIDGARFPEEQYKGAFRDYLALKYHDARFDAIITTHALAFEFIQANRDQLFPNTPVVFFRGQRCDATIQELGGCDCSARLSCLDEPRAGAPAGHP
jgi:hypothetical protein